MLSESPKDCPWSTGCHMTRSGHCPGFATAGPKAKTYPFFATASPPLLPLQSPRPLRPQLSQRQVVKWYAITIMDLTIPGLKNFHSHCFFFFFVFFLTTRPPLVIDDKKSPCVTLKNQSVCLFISNFPCPAKSFQFFF